MKAIILAAGKSSRLYPITLNKPKCLLNVHGKKLIEHQIELLRLCGIDDILVVTGYLHEKIEKILGIGKSKTGTKADVSVNNVRYSVKEMNSAPPAIVNHTPRNGFENVCERIGAQIDTLDSIIDEYWEKRIEGKITEDVSNSNEISPFLKHKKYLKPIINYFLFTGTGSKDSNFPADKALLVKYKDLPEGLEIIKKEDYFESIWKHLVFSLRSKGMPPSYEHGNNEYESVRCWTKLKDGRYKGALHIRVR